MAVKRFLCLNNDITTPSSLYTSAISFFGMEALSALLMIVNSIWTIWPFSKVFDMHMHVSLLELVKMLALRCVQPCWVVFVIVRSDLSDNFRSFTKKLVVVEDAFAEKKNNQLVDFKNGCCNNGDFSVLLFLVITYIVFLF